MATTPSSQTFPTLYLTTKLGKEKLWKVHSEKDTFIRQDYFVDGKEKEPTIRKCRATNVGKINERSAEEQAAFEAMRAWIAVLNRGYKPKKNDVIGNKLYNKVMEWKKEGGGNTHNIPVYALQLLRGENVGAVKNVQKDNITKTVSNIETHIKPMLAAKLEDCENYFEPKKDLWYAQYKLDGVRCIARLQSNGDVIFTTRNCREFKHLIAIKSAVKELLVNANTQLSKNIILDGELYTDTLIINEKEVNEKDKFGKISGACRPSRNKPAPYEDQIQYHIFDIVDTTTKQKDRMLLLKALYNSTYSLSENVSRYIRFVPSKIVGSREEVEEIQFLFLEKGYEGVILRKGNERYQLSTTTSRPKFLLKYKRFDDDEYEIVGAKDSEGTEKGCVKWVCKTKKGKTFDVRPQGSFEERRRLFLKRKKYIGKLLTVKYQGLTDDGKPRFPVGVAIRDYE